MTRSTAKKSGRLFLMETAFHREARKPGGFFRDDAVNKATAALVKMQDSADRYIDAELDRLCAATGAADQMQMAPAHEAAGNLRDVGAVAGFELITLVAANLCDVLDLFEAKAVYRSEIVSCHLRALRTVRSEHYRGVQSEDVPELLAGLRELLKVVALI